MIEEKGEKIDESTAVRRLNKKVRACAVRTLRSQQRVTSMTSSLFQVNKLISDVDQIISTLKEEKKDLLEDLREKDTEIPEVATRADSKPKPKPTTVEDQVEEAWLDYYRTVEEQKLVNFIKTQ